MPGSSSTITSNKGMPATKNAAAPVSPNLFDDSMDAIIITDMSGKIVRANARSVELFQVDEETIGQDIVQLHLNGKNLPEFSSLPTDSIFEFTSSMLARDSREPLHAQIRVRRYEIKDQSYIQWIHHDVSAQMRLEDLRRDLTATLVHDLQGPLGNVIASLELINNEMSHDASSGTRDLVEVAVRSGQHLQWLVNTILDVSRLEAGYPLENFTAVDVSSLIDSVYSIQESEFAQRNVILQRVISNDARIVFGEENILRRIFINLLNNALKYSRQGQAIIVSTHFLAASDEILISIEDQGEGIPEQYREIVFEKYQRVNSGSSAMGLGLGLAFCRLAVEAHGGRIWVEEAASGGACFCFTLPITSE